MNNKKARIKILIVEDEILIAQDISNRLSNNYEIIGIASSAEKAIDFINTSNRVDIILIDIILKGDKDGIELARTITKTYDIPFIFITSHADASIVNRAKSVNPCAYILKPFNDRQVSIAIELAIISYANKTNKKSPLKNQELIKTNNQVLQIKDSLFLKKKHHYERVPIREILFLKAENNYCTLSTKSASFTYSMVLKKVEGHLPINQFLRVHRSYVVNINSINGFEGNMLFIGDKKIPVSKTYRDAVFNLFHTI